MEIEIDDWLRGLGLDQYLVAFRENDIDASLLPDLTPEDLVGLGVTSIGHRRKLLSAIAALRATSSTKPAPGRAAPYTEQVSPRATDAERRQLTVMFCDLVGSTALSARLDPEDLREVIGAYHAAVAEEVHRFGGFVAKYMGDGVLAYFGYPQAHEHDAERAVRSGLAVTDRMSKLETRVSLKARVGIATGLVVVGDLVGAGDAQERGVIGETPNLAARLQGLAEPNAVLISEATRNLVGKFFEYRNLGAVEIRGFDDPVPVWQVLQPSRVESRFEALRGEASAPLVGRDEELDLLLRRWAQARSGEGQVVLLSGEPGIGKSRLVATLQERLRTEPHTGLRYFCSPYHQGSPLYPFRVQLERAAGLAREDTRNAKLAKLGALLRFAEEHAEIEALFADLLDIPAGDRYPALPSDPQRRRELTLQALLGQLQALARQGPVLLLFEDAHWIDQTSLELLDRAIEQVPRLPILLVITFRPEFDPAWREQAHVSSILLTRLAKRETEAVVQGITVGKTLPPEILDHIVKRTDGIPLFVEELTKSLLETGLLKDKGRHYVLTGPLPPLAIPASIHASLMSRLDRLVSVKEVAQIGAAIGRDFSYELLAAVAQIGDLQLRSALDQLTDAGLVFRRGTPPTATFLFKHALVQDAAYSTLLRGQRQELHARLAATLERQFPEIADSQPETLARHFEEASMDDKAVDYWARAGKRSATRSAMAEAASQIEKALACLARLPPGEGRTIRELDLHSTLGSARIAIYGFAGAQTGSSYASGHDAWEKLGRPTEFLRVPWGQWMYEANRGELGKAKLIADDLIAHGETRNDTAGMVFGRLCLGATFMLRGELDQSLEQLRRGAATFNPVKHRDLVHQTGIDPKVMTLSFIAFVEAIAGHPDIAIKTSIEALMRAEEIGHIPSIATTLSVATRMLAFVGDHSRFVDSAARLRRLGEEHGFPFWRTQAMIYAGWLEVINGDVDQGINDMQAGIKAYRETGATIWTPLYVTLIAEAERQRGRPEVALSIIDDALVKSRGRCENWYEAELVRWRGVFLLARDLSSAESCFVEAINIAHRRNARLWELRAATNLARLWAEHDKRTQARDLLTPIYGWFTEGFDTADVREAKALLDQLG